MRYNANDLKARPKSPALASGAKLALELWPRSGSFNEQGRRGGERKRGVFARLFGRGASAPTSESPPDGAAAPDEPPKRSWRERLFGGLFRSSQAISKGIAEIFTKRKLDALTLDELEDVLLRADLASPLPRASHRPLAPRATKRTSSPRKCARFSPARSNAS